MTENIDQQKHLRFKSIALRGVVAVVLSVVLNVVLVSITGIIGIAPDFQALTPPPVVFLSGLGAIGATIAYGVIGRISENPDQLFIRVAGVVLIISFIPDIALLYLDPAATLPGVIILMIMHVVVGAASVAALIYR